MSARERHPGDQLAALVDGRLGEPDRSRVVSHLTSCRACLAAYDAQLALKGMLAGLPQPPAPPDLSERLAGVGWGAGAAAGRGRHGHWPASRAARGPGRRGGLRPRTRTVRAGRAGAVALTFSVLAVGTGYLLGGTTPGAPVVPPVDQYVREHAAVSVGVPLTEPVLSQLVRASGPLLPSATGSPVRVRR
jgi:anti-sigma factor RsiW